MADEGRVTDLAVEIAASSGVNPAMVEAATSIVVRIYQQFGVQVRLNDGEQPTDGAAWRRIVIKPSATKEVREAYGNLKVMGIAPRNGTEPGRIGYVFYDAVSARARRHDLPVGTLLGYAMAHELGHLLLPPEAHGKEGVMRGNWDAGDMRLIRLGRLAMADREIALIRSYLDSLRQPQ
jgi:hypothetical protein